MKKSRIPILLLLMLMLVIVPAQNNSVPQEQEQKPNTQVSRLMGSTTLKKVDIGKQEKQAVSLNSDETGGISQNNPDYDNPSPLTYEAKQRMASIKEITEYEVSEPIAIFNDSAFELPTYGFEGSGSYDDPYIIDGYNITDSTAHLIHIENTTMYFNITNCYLNSSNSGYHCIWMKNVTFGTIADNTICNTTQANYGIGMDESRNNTLFNNIILGCDNGIWMDGSHNNSLLNNTVEGLWAGLYVNGSNDNVFTKNTIYNSFSAGIYLDYNNTWNTFTNNTIYDTACYGISTSGGCDNNTFTGNTIYNCGINGIEVFDSHNNTFLNNTINDCDFGIEIYSSNNNTLTNNTIHDCTNGIRLQVTSNNNTLVGNTIYDCATGIYLISSSNNTLLSNTIHDIVGLVTGIHLSNSHNNTLASNTIFNLTNAIGILLGSSNDNTLVCNNIFNITNARGIYLGTSVNNTLSSNTIYNITGGFVSVLNGIELSTSINNTVFNNTISSCDYRGIELSTSSNNNTLLSNIVYNCSNGINLADSKNNSIWNNIVYDCGTGIRLVDSNHNTLSGNTLYNIEGGATGLSLSFSSYNIVTNNTIYNVTTSQGIYTYDSHNNSFSANTIYDCDYGINIYDSSNNTVYCNLVYNNTNFGLYIIHSLFLESENNTVLGNTFINNKPGTSQVYINKTSNTTFMYNYYDDHPSLDANNDGILDTPYSAEPTPDGELDPYPLLYPSHAPIYITDDADFAGHGFSGTGTLADPYLIASYYFISDSTAQLIHIENTTSYFNITSCYLNGLNSDYHCIWLENVTFGTIANNTICNTTSYGIGMGKSNNNILLNNTIYNCHEGIRLSSSNYNTLSGNMIHNCMPNGIYLASSSNNNTLSGNTVYYCVTGIQLGSSSNNTLTGNTIHDIVVGEDTGIRLGNSHNNILSGNTVYNCATDGIQIDSDSVNNTLTDNTIYNCSSDGIILEVSSNNTLSGNTIYNCSSDGINLVDSIYNSILGNTIYNNSRNGISLEEESNNNTIKYNNVYNNTNYGLYFDSSPSANNTITWNNFLDNNAGGTSQASDWGTNNVFNYNYWNDWTSPDGPPSDGIVDNPYAINGSANNYDDYPLTTLIPPPVIIIKPLEKDYIINTIIVQLTGYARHYWYSIDDGQNQTWITSINKTLPDGTYTLNAYGNDSLGTIAHIYVTFTIDTTPPTVDITSPMDTTYDLTNVPLTYTVSDEPVTLTLYLNGYANTTAIPTGSVLSDFPDVPPILDGSYNITIVAVDLVGHVGKDTVLLTIDTTPPSISIDSPTATTYATGTITIELSSDDDDAVYYWYSIDDGPNQTWTDNVDELLTDGNHILHAYGNDSVGNIGYAKVEFIIGTTTTQETTPESSTTATTTTSEAASGSFPGVFTLVLFLVASIVVIRRHKKK